MKNSQFLKWNKYDFAKGLYVTVASAAITATIQMLTEVPPAINLKQICIVALTATLSYLSKQLITNSEGQLFSAEKA
jgi:hypothetical protein